MQQGAVLLLDVLGWKGIWQRREDAVETMLDLVAHGRAGVSGMVGESKMQPRFKDLQVEVLTISDTIAVTCYGERNASIELLTYWGSFVLINSILCEMPLRGALSFGELKSSNSVLVGPAVDEVASWYEHSEWVGLHLTPSAGLRVNVADFLYPTMLVRHDLLTKTGLFQDVWCCNWPAIWGQDGAPNALRDQLVDRLLGLGPSFPDQYIKLNNTLRFYDRHCAVA